MLFYCVEAKFYPYRRTTAKIETIEASEKPHNFFKYLKNYDLYVDYFENEADANRFYKANLRV